MSRKSAVKQTKKKDTPQCSLQHCLQIIQIRKQLTCPSMDEWIKKMWDIDIHIYIRTNTMVFDSATNKNENHVPWIEHLEQQRTGLIVVLDLLLLIIQNHVILENQEIEIHIEIQWLLSIEPSTITSEMGRGGFLKCLVLSLKHINEYFL